MRTPEEKEMIETRVIALNISLEIARLAPNASPGILENARKIEAYLLEKKPADAVA